MKLFRVSSCLALLMAGVACTQSPNAATSPSATKAATSASVADGILLKVTPPATVSPGNGERAEDRNPTLIWLNAQGKYEGIGVAYDIELWRADGSAPIYQRTVGESRDTGAHRVELTLDYDVTYQWRVRGHVGNPDVVGPWSNYATFLAPTRPVATTPTITTPTGTSSCVGPFSGAGTRISTRPNDSDIPRATAQQYAADFQNSCQPEGGGRGTWNYMDRTVDALRQRNGRYGYNAKRGNLNDPSLDVISFYRGADPNGYQGSSDVYIFDLIGGHCGPTPSSIWNDVTDVTFNSGTLGRVMYPRPGRNVTATTCSTGTAPQ